MASPFLSDAPSETASELSDRLDGTVVWLHGEHDASTAAALREILAPAIEGDGLDVVVDLSGVEFMGSATVGVLIDARARLALRAGSLTLRSPSRPAARVLELCRVPAIS